MGGAARAFVYVGQHYETGDGVPRNVAMGREWYAAADAGLPTAKRRLERLSVRATSELAQPQFVSRRSAGADEKLVLVWASPEQTGGTSYFLEVLEAESLSVI